MKSYPFSNGDTLPALGVGTWKSEPGKVERAITAALKIGYRHFDCAPIYGNEVEIGQAFKEALASGLLKREELWITSKLWNNAHAAAEVLPALQKTLRDLQQDLRKYIIYSVYNFGRSVTISQIDRRLNCLINPLKNQTSVIFKEGYLSSLMR